MIIFISEIYKDEDVESPASYYVRCMHKEKTKLQAAVCMYNVQNMLIELNETFYNSDTPAQRNKHIRVSNI